MANPYGVLTARPGSSRYPAAPDEPVSRDLQGYWIGGPQGKPKPSSLGDNQLPNDYPSMDAATGTFINTRTRQPWTGKLQDGTYAHQGQRATDPGAGGAGATDPNNVDNLYGSLEKTKNPAISKATDDLLTAVNKGIADSVKGFDDYIKEFKNAASTTQAANKSAVAQADTTAATLQGAQARYSGDLGTAKADYAALNTNDAAAQQAIVKSNYDLLPEFGQDFEKARAIADAAATNRVSRFAARSGTPRSNGSDLERESLRASYEASLPYEMAATNKHYDILNNVALPVERDLANRETSRISNFNPMVAGQQYSSAQGTASAVQALKEAVARQDWQSALQIMQVPEISAHVQQQIMAGDTSLLGAVNALHQSNTYQGLVYKPGANLSQPIYSSPGDLRYPSPSRYPRTIGTGTNPQPALGSNAPVQVGPNGASTTPYNPAGVYDPASGGFIDPSTGEFTPANVAAPSRYGSMYPGSVSPGTAAAYANYDPYRDRSQYFDPNE